ncbi:MAG TPA: hypothetical protein VIM53_02305 [Candidatus Saccharimonadales bacterium]
MNVNAQKVQQFLRGKWRPIAIYGALFGAIGVLQFALLGSLLSGFSSSEVTAWHAASSLHAIWNNPLNAPFNLLAYIFGKVAPHSLFAVRLAAATLGLLTSILFWALLRMWYGVRTAVLGAALFSSSSWFLHTARMGTAGVLWFGLFGLATAAVWVRRSHRPTAWLLCVAIAAALLYVPGMVWLVALGVVWQIRAFGVLAWQRKWVSAAALFIGAASIAPLAWALIRSPHLIKIWLGWPKAWPGAVTALKNIGSVPAHILFRGPGLPQHWLGHLPMLDAFSLIMLLIGVYVTFKRSRRLAIGFGLLFVPAFILVGLGTASLSVLAPFTYVLAASGVHEVSRRWLTVFPRNPIARNLGLGLLVAVIGLACAYNIRAYFIAWPQASATETVFTYQKP